MQGPFIGACIFALILGVIAQHSEFFSFYGGIIAFGILILIVVVITIALGKPESSNQNRLKQRNTPPPTPQFPPTPKGAKDAATYQKNLIEQKNQQIKNELAQWFPYEMYIIRQAIDTAIAQGSLLDDGTLHINLTEVYPEHKPGWLYLHYKAEIQKELERIYKSVGWKSVSIRISDYSPYQLHITLTT